MTSADAVITAFDTHAEAEEAIRELEQSGFDMRKLSIIGKGYHTEEYPLGYLTIADRIRNWGSFGLFWGALWGMLLGALFPWLPLQPALLYPLPLSNLLYGAVEGAALFGLLGIAAAVLATFFTRRKQHIKYATRLGAEQYLLVALGEPGEINKARRILENHYPADSQAMSA